MTNKKTTTNTKVKKRKKYYIDKTELRDEILLSQERGQLTRKAIDMIYKMIDKISNPLPYTDMELKKDVQGGAMYVVLKKWHKFDVNVSDNAFSFLSTTIMNGLMEYFNKYNKTRGTIQISLGKLVFNNEND